MAEPSGIRVAVVGKGGVGKTVFSATLARMLARRGRRVLVLDHDSAPGLSISLGLQGADGALLNDAMAPGEKRGYRFVDGLDPISAAQRFSIDGPDGIRVLQFGKTGRAGLDAVQPSVNAFYEIVGHLEHAPEFGDWAIVGDLPAGTRQPGQGWTPYAAHFLIVADASIQSMLSARRLKRLVPHLRPEARISLVVSKVTDPDDVERVSDYLGMPALGVVPYDEDVVAAERDGVPVLDHAPDSQAMAAIAVVAARLDAEGAQSSPIRPSPTG